MSKRGVNQKEKSEFLKQQRLGIKKYNKQGCLMKIVEYNSASDIMVEFQDEYKYTVKTQWTEFIDGKIKNVYYPSNRGIGCLGSKYSTYDNGKPAKEYQIWDAMLRRHLCTDRLAYRDVKCCKEWLC